MRGFSFFFLMGCLVFRLIGLFVCLFVYIYIFGCLFVCCGGRVGFWVRNGSFSVFFGRASVLGFLFNRSLGALVYLFIYVFVFLFVVIRSRASSK